MMIACEVLIPVKKTRYFFILGIVFSDRTIFACSSVKRDFLFDIKGGLALVVLSSLPFVLGLVFEVTGLACSSWDAVVLTPISATSCAASSMAFSIRFSRSEKTWIKRC